MFSLDNMVMVNNNNFFKERSFFPQFLKSVSLLHYFLVRLVNFTDTLVLAMYVNGKF